MNKSIRSRAPGASSPAVRKVMRANVSRDTGPEVRLRRELHALGMRFRKDYKPESELKCKADIVFPALRLCIFVDGCFWHGCPLHFSAPKTNSMWWTEKIHDNCQRDKRQGQELKKRGWTVIRVWEHEMSEKGLPKILKMITGVLHERRKSSSSMEGLPKYNCGLKKGRLS